NAMNSFTFIILSDVLFELCSEKTFVEISLFSTRFLYRNYLQSDTAVVSELYLHITQLVKTEYRQANRVSGFLLCKVVLQKYIACTMAVDCYYLVVKVQSLFISGRADRNC